MLGNDAPVFGRLVTAMATPFTDDKEIDVKAVEAIVDHLIENETNTILVAGTTGESPTLSAEEKIELLENVVKFSAGKTRVLFGAGSNNTGQSVEMAKRAESAGADGLLVVAPYYNKPSQRGIVEHIRKIGTATKLPMVIYNIPGRTGINIEPATMKTIAEQCETAHAVKESSGNADQVAEMARICPNKFRIYSGDDYMTLPLLSVGACGVVSVASHLVGMPIQEMIEDYMKGRPGPARMSHYAYLPLYKGLFSAPNPTCLKYALSRLGLCKPHLRLPLVPLTEEESQKMDELMEEMELVSSLSPA